MACIRLSQNHLLFQVNAAQQDIPFRYSAKNSLNFIEVDYTDDTKSEISIVTSFGLRIVVSTYPYYDVCYSDVAVFIPRHPDLKGNSAGLLGRWNDDASDDFKDPQGNQQAADGEFSWDFGDSWCVQGTETSQK